MEGKVDPDLLELWNKVIVPPELTARPVIVQPKQVKPPVPRKRRHNKIKTSSATNPELVARYNALVPQ